MNRIQIGVRVRSYDFPGLRADCFIEGVVIERNDDGVLIAVDRDVIEGRDVEIIKRLQVRAPMSPTVFSDVCGVEPL